MAIYTREHSRDHPQTAKMEEQLKNALLRNSLAGILFRDEKNEWVLKSNDDDEILRFRFLNQDLFWVICKGVGFKLYFIDVPTCLECLRQMQSSDHSSMESSNSILLRLLEQQEALTAELNHAGLDETNPKKRKLQEELFETAKKIQQYIGRETREPAAAREETQTAKNGRHAKRLVIQPITLDLTDDDKGKESAIEINDASDDEDTIAPIRAVSKFSPIKKGPLPRLPPRHGPATIIPQYAPYQSGQYMSREWFGRDNRLVKTGEVEFSADGTKVTVAYVCENVILRECGPGENPRDNDIAALRNPTGLLLDGTIDMCMGFLNIRQEINVAQVCYAFFDNFYEAQSTRLIC